MPYAVADESFATKNLIAARCREILAATPTGHVVDDIAELFLLDLFRHHDEWQRKAEGGVSSISTQLTPHGTKCFVLRKQNGDCIDISFPHAIRLIPTSRSMTLAPQALRDFRSAARHAVRNQIFEFRDASLQVRRTCPLTGLPLTRETSAVDHKQPKTFDRLLFDFCTGRRLNPARARVGSTEGTIPIFEDPEIAAAWQGYHRKHADLRMVSKIGNLQLPKVFVPWSELTSLSEHTACAGILEVDPT